MYIIIQNAFLDGAQGKRLSRSFPRFVTETIGQPRVYFLCIGATDREGGLVVAERGGGGSTYSG